MPSNYHPLRPSVVEITPVTIVRSRWLRGEGYAESQLLRSRDGKMCCAGFMCKARGYTDEEIRDRGGVHALADPTRMPESFPAMMVLYRTNDVPDGSVVPFPEARYLPATLRPSSEPMTPELREAEIIAKGRVLGFDVTFVD